jgi:uncharacterized protein
VIREFILKIQETCNLACDYCYMYEMADQSWRGRPTGMSEDILMLAGLRIGLYARVNKLPEVRIILHGGEPLMVGPQKLGWIAGVQLY